MVTNNTHEMVPNMEQHRGGGDNQHTGDGDKQQRGGCDKQHRGSGDNTEEVVTNKGGRGGSNTEDL